MAQDHVDSAVLYRTLSRTRGPPYHSTPCGIQTPFRAMILSGDSFVAVSVTWRYRERLVLP